MKQLKNSFSTKIEKKLSLKYLLYLPKNYHSNERKKWPLIVFLHGIGSRGEDIEIVKKNGIPKMIEENEELPFIVVAPQCPTNSLWPIELDALYFLINKIIKEQNVDASRVYLTGLSMGGIGTWHLAEAYPNLFAAIIPICGGAVPFMGFPERIRVLKDIPVWAFHGDADDVVPLKMSEELVDELKNHNENVQLTVYPNVGHDSWTQTYNNPQIYEWLLQQRKSN
ncbi:prolyl oligopeptidase family serine peptidase [Lutibacter sp. B2]|nr:prolyl oligopeptidase family serine peptidase [Lutibacter sp. B2]